ncbi:hypothetical protein COO60DRAFT_884777 [Scenedesmus sp. NREL 46B-D3]|nr:hypothetical protein COO60DRAFT_884777 [Scenedesmus sp. NREL 46B-D3]
MVLAVQKMAWLLSCPCCRPAHPAAHAAAPSRSSQKRRTAIADPETDSPAPGPQRQAPRWQAARRQAASGGSTGRGRPRAPQMRWTADEHARLLEMVTQVGEVWTTVASCMPGRSSKQCRERYHNNKPELKKGNWTVQEDLVLAQLHCKFGGNQFKMFEQYLPGRSRNDIKNRWNSVQHSRRKDLAKSSSNVLWNYIRYQQQGMTRAEALAAATGSLPAAYGQQLGPVAGDADVAAAAAPAAAMDEIHTAARLSHMTLTAAATAAAAAAPAEAVHPAALLLLPQQQQPAAAEPAQGTAGLDVLAVAAAMVQAADSHLGAGGGSTPPKGAYKLDAVAAAEPQPDTGSDDALAVAAAMVLKAVDSHLAALRGSTPKTAADEPQAAAVAEACVVATAEAKQAAAQALSSTAVARHSAHNNQPWQLHVPAAKWQQPQARALEQDQHGVYNLQQQVMAPEQRMAAGGLEGPLGAAAPFVVGTSCQQALLAAITEAASGNAQATAAAVVAAAGMVQGTTGGAHHPAAALAAGAHTRRMLNLSDSGHGQQQQQQGSRNDRREVSGSAAAPGSVELLLPSPAAAGGSMVSGLSGLVLEIMGQQQPQQLQTCSVAAGALSAAAPAPHTGRRLPAARQDRQEALQQHLAPKVLLLPPPQQDTATAPEDPTVATWWEQQASLVQLVATAEGKAVLASLGPCTCCQRSCQQELSSPCGWWCSRQLVPQAVLSRVCLLLLMRLTAWLCVLSLTAQLAAATAPGARSAQWLRALLLPPLPVHHRVRLHTLQAARNRSVRSCLERRLQLPQLHITCCTIGRSSKVQQGAGRRRWHAECGVANGIAGRHVLQCDGSVARLLKRWIGTDSGLIINSRSGWLLSALPHLAWPSLKVDLPGACTACWQRSLQALCPRWLLLEVDQQTGVQM